MLPKVRTLVPWLTRTVEPLALMAMIYTDFVGVPSIGHIRYLLPALKWPWCSLAAELIYVLLIMEEPSEAWPAV